MKFYFYKSETSGTTNKNYLNEFKANTYLKNLKKFDKNIVYTISRGKLNI